ncbi:DUF2690 domain-containing protein [Streptomyces sp. URMC 123]|uniref:DUF2690 domain-containing protein n=1 Tax=Streptomyces sp. URMC 123 TaxID=3423403 RepID=UPI003F1C17E6
MLKKVMGTAIAAVALTALLPVGTAQAATCKGASCTGQNPAAMGCGDDARVLDTVKPVGGGPEVQLRVSSKCSAAWARIGKTAGWKFKIETKGGAPYFGYGNLNYEAYTLMVNNGQAYRACVEIYDGVGGKYTCTKWY